VLQELASQTGAPIWAIASMLFFLGLWLAIALATWRARPEAMDERARLPLDRDADPAGPRES
jgi:cbb3-type cytochrome oxidase subunit 3